MSESERDHRAWIAKAGNDLLNIRNNLVAERVPWDTVCFHAQQVAEKLLKALLVYHGRSPLRTHDLVALLVECAQIDPSLADLKPECDRLTVFAIASRYPMPFGEPSEADGHAMVAAAEKIRTAILELLSGLEKGNGSAGIGRTDT